MGSSSNPIEDAWETVKKAADDTINTGTKGINDTGDTLKKAGEDVSNEAGDVVDKIFDIGSKVTSGAKGITDPAFSAVGNTFKQIGAGDLSKSKAINEGGQDASKSVFNKGKKKKGRSLSSGMGLSKGDTGLQT